MAQTGLAIGQATTVLQSQLQILIATLENNTSCTALTGGGSIQAGTNLTSIYYDSNCQTPYVTANPTVTTDNDTNTASISDTATYYGPDGTKLGTMTINEQANLSNSSSDVLNGLGTFISATGAQTPVQLGLYCTISQTGGPCAGAIAQDFPDLGLAIGAVTPINVVLGSSATSPVSFSGGGTVVTGPMGSLKLTNPSPTSLVIQGGTAFASTTASGGAAEFVLFPPTPTSWTLTDAGHDEQFVATVVDNTSRNLTVTVKQVSTGNTLATGMIDHSGSGTITWSDGTVSTITNWTLQATT